ncbi:MAG: MFS transporter [Chloroflexi bacterium]|nr:MFS transporter [Chloroflexota bacterium]
MYQKRNHNIAVMCGTILLNLFFQFTWYPLLPLQLRALGANDLEVGVSYTLIGVARTLFAVIGGTLADRYGRKALLVMPIILSIPLYLIAALTDQWSVIVTMFVVANALGALTSPAYSALIAESSDSTRVARSYSFTEFSALVGVIAGPLVGAALLGVLDIPKMMLLYTLTLVFTTAVRAWGLSETHHRSPVERSRAPVLAAIDSRVRWYMVLGTCMVVAFAIAFGPYFTILARDGWHNTDAEINILFAAGNAAALLGLGLGRMSDHWGGRRVLVVGLLGFGLATIAWGLAPSWEWGLVPLLIAFGFSEAAYVAQQTVQAEITSPETRTSVFGIIGTTTGVIGGMGPALGAWLIALGGIPLPFVAAGVISLAAIVAVPPLQKKRTRTAEFAAPVHAG